VNADCDYDVVAYKQGRIYRFRESGKRGKVVAMLGERKRLKFNAPSIHKHLT